MAILDDIHFDHNGLIPAIAQDSRSGEVLMMAWMNRESLRLTLETRTATYWSRSRKKLWLKGEESGNTQEVHQIYTDCDRDVILLKIVQKGEAACHTGHRSCFFRELVAEEDSIIDRGEPLFDPKNVYGKPK